MKKRIPYNLPDIDPQTGETVLSVLQSNWLTTGKRTQEFEAQLANYTTSDYCIALSSCTAALHLSLLACGIGPGDEVITTVFTFVGTIEAIIYCGATPVLVDVEPETLNIDPVKVKEKITNKTKAIMPVHYAGHPCAMDEILAIAKQHNLFVVEDAAHAIGALYNGKKIGSLDSTATCFSFYATKNMTTGEGGAVATHNKKLAETVRLLSMHGITKDALARYGSAGDWHYDVTEIGYKYNITDIQSAIGIEQLKKLDTMNQRRRELANIYTASLRQNQNVMVPIEKDYATSAWHLYPIRLQNEKLRDHLIAYLKEQGVATSLHFIPVCLFTVMKKHYGFPEKDYPVALDAFRRIVSLPLYPGLSNDDVHYVADSVLKAVGSYA